MTTFSAADRRPCYKKESGLGSGFIISKEGYIITNDHVVKAKIANLIHLVRKEFVPSSETDNLATEEFLAICGTWKDTRTVAEQLTELYAARRSTDRAEHAF